MPHSRLHFYPSVGHDDHHAMIRFARRHRRDGRNYNQTVQAIQGRFPLLHRDDIDDALRELDREASHLHQKGQRPHERED